jgi:hypothetical protein
MKQVVQATVVERIESVEGQAAGAVEYREIDGVVRGLACRCPCGCGAEMWLPVRLMGSPRTKRPEWQWNGNRHNPILQPSVFNSGLPCRWHGYLGASNMKMPGYWVEV